MAMLTRIRATSHRTPTASNTRSAMPAPFANTASVAKPTNAPHIHSRVCNGTRMRGNPTVWDAPSEQGLGRCSHRHGLLHAAHDPVPLPVACISFCSDARLDSHQHVEHSRAVGRFTGSAHRRHLPNGGPTQGRNRVLIMVASETMGSCTACRITGNPTRALRHGGRSGPSCRARRFSLPLVGAVTWPR